jgi:predicted amidohydrolase
MKIAAAQTPVTRDPKQNGAAIRAQMREAAEAGARLVLFCEGALSGYPVKDEEVDWAGVAAALDEVRALAKELRLWTVLGCNHRNEGKRPFNSLYAISDLGEITARYDKRLCSFNEISNYFSAGFDQVTIEADGFRFGLTICIEACFPELFMEYERLGVDAVLFASAGGGEGFRVMLQGHAAANCLWIPAATPARDGALTGVIGPDGQWMERLGSKGEPGMVVVKLDRSDPRFDIALNKARPWRRLAREGSIYRR